MGTSATDHSLSVHASHPPHGDRSSGGHNVGGAERAVSALGGALLALYGVRRRGVEGGVLAAIGAALLHRGATGSCGVYRTLGVSTADADHGFLQKQHGPAAVLDASHAIKVERSVTVFGTTPDELYRFWRNFENLPRIMAHVERVEVLDDRRSRWTARGPGGQHVEWEAEIINEIPGQLIAWRSIEEATVPNAGSVHFKAATGGRGTEVRVVLEYAPPAGRLGALVAKLFGEEPDMQVREDLRRFKQVMETGEVPDSRSPSGSAARGVLEPQED